MLPLQMISVLYSVALVLGHASDYRKGAAHLRCILCSHGKKHKHCRQAGWYGAPSTDPGLSDHRTTTSGLYIFPHGTDTDSVATGYSHLAEATAKNQKTQLC